MTCICLWSPAWSTGAGPAPELGAALLALAPRVVLERRGVGWADARGLPAAALAAALLERLAAAGVGEARAGVAATPVAAELAARRGAGPAAEGRIVVVEPGRDREFVAPLPLALLGPDARLQALLEGVGIQRCGELAALEREAVEVRFGPAGVGLWRLARADDARRLFAPIPPERPHASLDFVDYVVSDPERLAFTVHALLGGVSGALRSRGEHARRMTLVLRLANGETWRRTLKPARPTAGREAWLRLARGVLQRLDLPDAVAGVGLEVESAEAAAVRQGDLFDRGFATRGAVEAAIARLIEDQGEVVVVPELSAHPLPERRARWVPADPFEGGEGVGRHGGAGESGAREIGAGRSGEARLTLQLLPEPHPVQVEAAERRDHALPLRYRDREGWKGIVTAAGPERVSGGRWEQGYAREYFRCVTEEGVLVWLFRDGLRDAWFLHGWWD